jgi:hypothetical protein
VTARVRLAGVLAALGYLAVLLLTRVALPGGARPLYDGFAPPAPYRWVNPPAALRNANQAPAPGNGKVAKADGKDASLAFETTDGQASLTAEIGALSLAASESGADGRLEPLDPTAYGPLPAGQAPSGNVYRLTVAAAPSNRAVTTFARPASLSLELANSAGTTMYTSPDGRAWTKIPSSIGQPFVIGNVTRTGYFVLGGPKGLLPTLEPRAAAKKSGGSGATLWVAGAVAVLVAGGVGLLLRRRAA